MSQSTSPHCCNNELPRPHMVAVARDTWPSGSSAAHAHESPPALCRVTQPGCDGMCGPPPRVDASHALVRESPRVMWQGRAQSWCKCGRGEPNARAGERPSVDVDGERVHSEEHARVVPTVHHSGASAQDVAQHRRSTERAAEGVRSTRADVAGESPSSGKDVAGVSKVPMQM